MLPNRIFFTGVPGSRWSGIAQTIETLPGMNTSDRTPERTFTHHGFSGHLGAYFGRRMELEPLLDAGHIDSAHTSKKGCRLLKSHDWAYCLSDVKKAFPDDWIMMVYRPDQSSFAWWHEAGGFTIKYPNYSWYKDSITMLSEISRQNDNILKFAAKHDLQWNYFTERWCLDNFGAAPDKITTHPDILVSIYKPNV